MTLKMYNNFFIFRKIELITSYHHSDSDSNDEQDTPVKAPVPAPITAVTAPKPPKLSKVQTKKPKTKSQPKEYGPSLPPNQNYTVPIGPEIPPEFLVEPPKEEKTTAPVSITEEVKLYYTTAALLKSWNC